jgi:lipoyl(octanoyl) transferase
MPETTAPPLEVRLLGTVPYDAALALQEATVARRREDRVPDRLLLLEHPPVVTLGTSSQRRHVLLSREALETRGIALFEAGRGGDVTFHGPGQLVGYPILKLDPDRRDLHRYLRDLEEVLIRALAGLGIPAGREPGFTGVWTARGKVGAIGVRVSSGWVTSHGFALNVRPDLASFQVIVPCGIPDRPVTSVAELLGREVEVAEVIPEVIRSFAELFRRSPMVV